MAKDLSHFEEHDFAVMLSDLLLPAETLDRTKEDRRKATFFAVLSGAGARLLAQTGSESIAT